MMYLCSILEPSDPRPLQCERNAQGSFRRGVCCVARFESVTSYGVANRVKQLIGVGYVPLEFHKYMLSCQIWTGTCQDDHRCVFDAETGSVTLMDAPYEVTGG